MQLHIIIYFLFCRLYPGYIWAECRSIHHSWSNHIQWAGLIYHNDNRVWGK